jgi:prevent-host-death family protein
MHSWQIQEAEARMPELVKRARTDGPQHITVDGESVAVLVSRETFDRLSQQGDTLAAFMRRSPLYGLEELDLDLERDKSRVRKVSL